MEEDLEEDLEEYPGLLTRNAWKRWGGKYSKAWWNLKEWLKTEKSAGLSMRTPRH